MSLTARGFILVPLFGIPAALFYGFFGFLFGAGVGFALACAMDARARISGVEAELLRLRTLLHEQPAPSDAPAEPSDDHPAREEARAHEQSPAQVEFEAASKSKDRPAGIPEHPPIPSGATPSIEAEPERTMDRTERRGQPFAADVVLRFFTGGNLLVRTGLIILFVGVAFLVKYASDRRLLPIEIRLIGAALGAIALLAVGWRLRNKRENYALTLQGGGIGILYLVIFAAFRLYELLPAWFAFIILVALCALSAVLAILQNSLSLAVFGAVGGFLAPILASTGRGNHVMLFSYYAVLDAGILAIAWFRAWRILNLTGFAFTFGIGALWGHSYYAPEQFASTEPFLILFFLFYAAIAILFATRQPLHLKGYVDGTIVFGTPIVAFMHQTVLVRPYEYGAALSAIGFGAFYLAAAWFLHKKKLRELDLLLEAFLAISVGFATLAIPLAFDYRGVASAWAIEGAALVWIGVRQRRISARISGLLLQLGAGAALLPNLLELQPIGGQIPVLNGFFLGCVLIAFAGLFSSRYLSRNEERLKEWERVFPQVLGTWSLIWWFGSGLLEIDRYVGPNFKAGAVVCFLSFSCAACSCFKKRLDWPLLRYPAMGLLPALATFGLVAVKAHPLGGGGYVGWPAAFAAIYYILYENEDLGEKALEYFHAGALWLLAVLLAWEANWQAAKWMHGKGVWDDFAVSACLSALVFFLCFHGRRVSWPIRTHFRFYIWTGLGPIVVACWLWALALSLASHGDPWPLPFLPLLNPLDVAVGFAFLALPVWLSRLLASGIALPGWFIENLRSGRYAIGLSVFMWLNSILIRCTHYWGGIPFSLHAMNRSVLVQACLSIFWSLASLCLMVFATRRRLRQLWLAGAALLAVVVVKLFLVDLSKSGTVERIVSFVGVGVLILVVGYLSPVPPQDKGAETET